MRLQTDDALRTISNVWLGPHGPMIPINHAAGLVLLLDILREGE